MKKVVRLTGALALLAASAGAHAQVDRKTCMAAMAAYPRVYEAVMAGQPQERVVGIVVAEGRRAGMDRVKLSGNAQRWVEMLYDVPPHLLPAPEWVRRQRAGVCAGYQQ